MIGLSVLPFLKNATGFVASLRKEKEFLRGPALVLQGLFYFGLNARNDLFCYFFEFGNVFWALGE